MYDMPAYKDQDAERIEAFIHAHPFAFISGCDAEGRPVATQAPVFIEQQGGQKVLSGHIMKNTDHHKAFVQNPNVLVVFTGAHCYVSATWYNNPNVASTWNFMSVHARGKIRFFEGEAREDALRKVSLHFFRWNLPPQPRPPRPSHTKARSTRAGRPTRAMRT
ncbi:MAG: FMN-binding negative transcriptional regulator [Phycisphaerales bacterium]|nr:FMN-binding negative transcriptional regulator [Phycisphaerales bacterium]